MVSDSGSVAGARGGRHARSDAVTVAALMSLTSTDVGNRRLRLHVCSVVVLDVAGSKWRITAKRSAHLVVIGHALLYPHMDAQNVHICTAPSGREPSPVPAHIGGSARVYPAGPRVVGCPVIANAPSARLHVYAAPTSG